MNTFTKRSWLLFLFVSFPTFSLAETKIKVERVNFPLLIDDQQIRWDLLTDSKNKTYADQQIRWEPLPDSKNKTYADQQIRWEPLPDSKDKNYYYDDLYETTNSLDQKKDLLNSVKSENSYFIKPLRIGIIFPTNNQLSTSEASHSIYSLSTFKSGGAAGGTGNQNYAYMFDYGLNKNIHLSAFYSVADDPLFSYMEGNHIVPNYWEAYGLSMKRKLFSTQKWSFSSRTSLESFSIRNGNSSYGNIFDSTSSAFSSSHIIGSFSLPITRRINNNLDLHFVSGASFMPSRLGEVGKIDNFYGNNFYLGSGLSWKLRENVHSYGSLVMPLGPGNNSFNHNKNFYQLPIYNFGINYDLDPVIGLQAKITNGFGATPATSLLTIPSNHQVLYFAGISYKPFANELQPERFSIRQKSLSIGGLTVNSALIPPRYKSVYFLNYDSKSNLFGGFHMSLSNSFQLNILNLGSFNTTDTSSTYNNSFVNTYMNEFNLNTRVGGKFVLNSRLRDKLSALSARISVGRNKQNNQGYFFSEWIYTYGLNEHMIFNINPKTVSSGLGSLYSLGLSSNIFLSDIYQLIPEINISLSKLSETNSSFTLRRLFGEYLYTDLYLSSAAGLQDLGQLLSSGDIRTGIRISLLL